MNLANVDLRGRAIRSMSVLPRSRILLVLSLAGASFAQGQSPVRQLPPSPVAYGQLENRACRTQNATGQAIVACHHGLAGYSGGKSCLWGVTYVDGKERPEYTAELCVRSCTNAALEPDKAAKCDAIAEEYGDKVVWRTLGALPSDDRDLLAALYDKLIPLINKNSPDENRKWLKEKILEVVLRKMIPFRQDRASDFAGTRAEISQFDVFDRFEDRDPANRPKDGFNPLGINKDQHLYLFESAFVERSKGPPVRYTMRDPDQLAIDLTHEMVHFTQEGSGYGNLRDALSPDLLYARTVLSELQVYHVTLGMAQFKVLERYPKQVPSEMPGIMVQKFKDVWADLRPVEREALARWAWTLKDDWMRRQMYTAPESDRGVWGMLCSANSRGRGPCGMQN